MIAGAVLKQRVVNAGYADLFVNFYGSLVFLQLGCELSHFKQAFISGAKHKTQQDNNKKNNKHYIYSFLKK
jgi:hypothetical protein